MTTRSRSAEDCLATARGAREEFKYIAAPFQCDQPSMNKREALKQLQDVLAMRADLKIEETTLGERYIDAVELWIAYEDARRREAAAAT